MYASSSASPPGSGGPKVKGRRSAPLAILSLALICLGLRGALAQGLPSVARALLDEARQSAGLGDWSAAYSLLTDAREAEPANSDVLYLRALASMRQGLPLGEALGDLNAALAAGRYSYYSTRDVSTLKAELLLRERKWREALAALGPPSPEAGVDPAYRLARAKAFAGLRDGAAFAAEISASLDRFPDNPAFPRLFIERSGSLPPMAGARAIGAAIAKRLPAYADSDPELSVLAAPLLPDISAKRDVVLAFRASGKKSPAATLRALEYGIIGEADAAAELLSGSESVSLRDLSSLLSLSGSPAGRDAVTKAILAWSGRLEVDFDGDGVAESSFGLAQGLVTDWESQSAQDGVMDLSASFAGGIPVRASVSRDGLKVDIAYSSFPSVSAISFTDRDEKRGYYFGPDAFSFAPLSMKAFAGSGRDAIMFPYPAPAPEIGELACASAALSASVEKGSTRTVTILDKGVPLSATSYEGGRAVSVTTYSRGSPSIERVDSDGDGRFETELRFAPDSGSAGPSWMRLDSDGDGVFEYREQLAFPFRKEWDYDGDGLVDAAQFQLPDGSVQEDFSSALDGRLDESIVVKSGKILSLSRRGSPVALVPDSNPGLSWIGSKPFDLGRNLPPGEGIYTAMGKRYRLTRVGSLAFAELIP
jgi:hypothetical protein